MCIDRGCVDPMFVIFVQRFGEGFIPVISYCVYFIHIYDKIKFCNRASGSFQKILKISHHPT